MNTMLRVGCICFFVLSCLGCSASDYGRVMDRGNGNKEVYALGNSESEADNNAFKAAELTCKEAGQSGEYITLHRDVAYKGAFGSAHEQRTITDLLSVASTVMGGSANHRSGSTSKSHTRQSGSTTKTTTRSASYSMNVDPGAAAADLQKDSFESHLIFRCK